MRKSPIEDSVDRHTFQPRQIVRLRKLRDRLGKRLGPASSRLYQLMFPSLEHSWAPHKKRIRSDFELPHTFRPDLTVAEGAAMAIVGFLRIFLGSLLFAFWGGYSLAFLDHLQSDLSRAVAVPPLIAIFIVLFVLLMLLLAIPILVLGRRQPKG